MKIHLTLFFLLSFSIFTSAQDLDPSVMASEGGWDSNSEISLEWTLGEIAVTTLYTNTTMITEGFHQPILLVSNFDETKVSKLPHQLNSKIKVVPNPVKSIANIQMDFPEASLINISLYNLSGTKLLEELNQNTSDSLELNLTKYPSGIYLLRFIDQEGQLIRTFRISKIN